MYNLIQIYVISIKCRYYANIKKKIIAIIMNLNIMIINAN